MSTLIDTGPSRVPWNKGRLTGQKPPLKPKEIWAIRVRLQLSSQVRDLAMFNLAIDSKPQGLDLQPQADTRHRRPAPVSSGSCTRRLRSASALDWIYGSFSSGTSLTRGSARCWRRASKAREAFRF
ncbi:hypothetical protein QF002_004700 [Paraburkholderia youngii]